MLEDSPTYWILHILQVITYTRLWLWQVKESLNGYEMFHLLVMKKQVLRVCMFCSGFCNRVGLGEDLLYTVSLTSLCISYPNNIVSLNNSGIDSNHTIDICSFPVRANDVSVM